MRYHRFPISQDFKSTFHRRSTSLSLAADENQHEDIYILNSPRSDVAHSRDSRDVPHDRENARNPSCFTLKTLKINQRSHHVSCLAIL